jgi:hypothetical protein
LLVTISSVSSSWLRRKIAHWQPGRDLRRLRHDLDDRVRSSWAMAMYMRGISGKW